MRKHLAIALSVAFLALASMPAWASDGDIIMVAQTYNQETMEYTGEFECPFWTMKHHGNSQGNEFGSCVPPPAINIYAELKGASAAGITGVEFAATYGPDGAPDTDWAIFSVGYNPTASVRLGDAFLPVDPGTRGLNMSWDNCQNDNGRVYIGTIVLFGIAPCGPSQLPPSFFMEGGQATDPSNPFFRCPLFSLCDAPVFTKVCLGDNIVPCEVQAPPFPLSATCSTSGRFSINVSKDTGLGKCYPAGKAGVQSQDKLTAEATWSSVKELYK
jgi:hypothetical protein